ncbi:MAG: imelysin family protein, partial [Hyphomicrobiaceae bacterium]
KVMADRPAELLAENAVASQSAALQGLPAMEQLLYGFPDSEPVEVRAYRCRLAQAIGVHVAKLSGEMVREWTAPQTGWRQRLLTAGAPGNDDYKSASEAASELVRSLLTGLQLVREEMLLPWLKAAEAKKPWAGLPFERAGIARDIVATSLLALRNLHKALHLDLVITHVGTKDKSKAWMKAWIIGAYDSLERDAKSMVLPSQDQLAAAAAEENLMALKRSRFNLNGLRQIIGRHIAPAAALTIGFNELDGD